MRAKFALSDTCNYRGIFAAVAAEQRYFLALLNAENGFGVNKLLARNYRFAVFGVVQILAEKSLMIILSLE